MEIEVDFVHDTNFTCPICGAEGRACGVETETWYHNNFFNYQTYLHARVPRIECCCSVASPVERPWARLGSKFTRLQ